MPFTTENDDILCAQLTQVVEQALPQLTIQGGADEPFYEAPKTNGDATKNGILYYRENYPRSLLHELSHYCLAGNRRRLLDDFGYWYTECGRTTEEQIKFEMVEARPQGLEKAMCKMVGLKFSPSTDDFSGRPPSQEFLDTLENVYNEMLTTPPPTAKKVLEALEKFSKV